MAQRSHTHLLDKADKGVGELGRTGPQEGQVSRIPAAPREGGDPSGNKGEQGWGRGGAEPGGAGANRGRDQEDLGAGPNWGWSLSG